MEAPATTGNPVEIVLGIPGPWPDTDQIGRAIIGSSERLFFAGAVLIDTQSDLIVELEVVEHDPDLRRAFELSANSCHSEALLGAIEAHTFTLYLVGPGGSVDAAQKMMDVAGEVCKAGGLAVKVESSGLSHSAEGWRELIGKKGVLALFEGYVTLVRGDDLFYSCGMHNLGARDASVPGSLPPDEAAVALQGFAQYLLLEDPKLESGGTFSPGPEYPTYRLEAEPCTVFAEGDLLFNPFGWWRLTPV
ncbi:MAG: DUF4261 domain-containing protein [Aphanocapsa lilacina HA4352-LM1]|jgi:hypothetical protein|nr:DUF4261 domain-containing protein [Aphanocapsa lilacina HA4352-LM1]